MKAKKLNSVATVVAGALSFCQSAPVLWGQASTNIMPGPVSTFTDSSDVEQNGWLFVNYAQFKIPFNIEPGGTSPTQVQLFVSTDQGASWQPHSKQTSDNRNFEFRAAGEGAYLFRVQTRDASGSSYISNQAPMRVIVDTSRPQVTLDASVDSSGRLVAQFEATDQNLKVNSIRVQYRCDQDNHWTDATVEGLSRTGDTYHGHAIVTPNRCREVWLRVSLADLAQNSGEAAKNIKMPRTAAGPIGFELASQREGTTPSSQLNSLSDSKEDHHNASPFGINPTPGATKWSGNPTERSNSQRPSTQKSQGWNDARIGTSKPTNLPPGSLVAIGKESENLANDPLANRPTERSPGGNYPVRPMAGAEEIPLPSENRTSQDGLMLNVPEVPKNTNANENTSSVGEAPSLPTTRDIATKEPAAKKAVSTRPDEVSANTVTHLNQAYHSQSRAFSLDYSVESLNGAQVAEIELWGSEDGGRTWVLWGSDPDRASPFDVQVADDGLFGFRMVVVGNNGLVSNRPRNGDDADMWINVDSIAPVVKITRAVYGEGHEAGMLVIDYKCDDSNLHDQPVSLAYSEHQEGPWTTIANGLRNSGVYLWKAGSDLPRKVYLRIEAKDKGGNIGTFRLDMPIAVEGLAPRGRIQSFRPLAVP